MRTYRKWTEDEKTLALAMWEERKAAGQRPCFKLIARRLDRTVWSVQKFIAWTHLPDRERERRARLTQDWKSIRKRRRVGPGLVTYELRP